MPRIQISRLTPRQISKSHLNFGSAKWFEYFNMKPDLVIDLSHDLREMPMLCLKLEPSTLIFKNPWLPPQPPPADFPRLESLLKLCQCPGRNWRTPVPFVTSKKALIIFDHEVIQIVGAFIPDHTNPARTAYFLGSPILPNWESSM